MSLRCAAFAIIAAINIGALLAAFQFAWVPRGLIAATTSTPGFTDNDTLHFKNVALYRGGPRDPRLDVDVPSQCGQDLTVADIFGQKRGGMFVDLAANDAVYLSNTLLLERNLGWRGLCIEPNPAYLKGHLHRKCKLIQAVVGPRNNETVQFNFHHRETGGVVGFDNTRVSKKTQPHFTVSVETILNDFQMPNVIDYLSLDIEGAEAWTFETFPWQRYTFLVITVERPKQELRQRLRPRVRPRQFWGRFPALMQ